MMKWIAKILFKILFRAEVKGMAHFKAIASSSKPALIVANHVSLLDGPLIASLLGGNITFMVDKSHTKKWYEKILLSSVNYFAVDLNSPFATKHMIEELKKGNHCMIFPEGRITTTGGVMKVYAGTAMVADHANVPILPIFIDGAQYSKASYLDGSHQAYVKQRWFPKITLTINAPKIISAPDELKGRTKHHYLQNQIALLMRDNTFEGSNEDQSLFKGLVDSQQVYDRNAICVEDINGVALSRKKLVIASALLGKKFHKICQDESRVGVLLPNVSGMPITFFALQAYGYTPALLNYTAGIGPMRSACETAELKTVITSHKFVEVFNLEEAVTALSSLVTFIYLEDIKESITFFNKISALSACKSKLPGYHTHVENEAVVLYTSGSEGAPKGVVLSHRNIVSNVNQTSSMLTLLPGEKLFNALPTFHSFGLTAGLIWPILKGANTFLYPSPLHYAEIPEMVYQQNSKLIFGTDTFFAGYAKKANQSDFYSIRAMVAGAERLRPETRQIYMAKFNTIILEGYGVTECSPVVAVNTLQAAKWNTVGKFVPSVIHRLEAVPGIAGGGRLFLKGPNIMLGYLMPTNPGVLIPPVDGWHDTGDIVDVDEDGFVSIKGRAKRFAKIGGEMVSLTAVEAYINEASPEGHHVVVAVADPRKGEQLVLVTNDETLSRKMVKEAANRVQVSEIMIPKTVILVEDVPVLGTGKTNYPEVIKLAEGHFV